MRLVWVTGFEPFAGVPENPSQLVLAGLPASLEGVEVRTAALPVDTVGVQAALASIYATSPDAVIHVGVAERRAVVSVERVARNVRRFRVADNAGRIVAGEPVIDGAPDLLASRLPVSAIRAAIAAEDVPVEESDSAGEFLCNQVMFTSLHRLPDTVRTGFVHVPAHGALALHTGGPSLPLERIACAVRRALLATVLTLALLLSVAWPSASAAAPPPFMKGMTVSCPGYGRIWGSPAMTEAIESLKAHGVEWVAIHPYAAVRRDGRIQAEPAAATGYLARATALAKQGDVKLFWKPHLAYWGSFEWRGAIDFGDDASAWRRFFTGYRTFIVDQARFAEQAKVPLFSVGVEYGRTVRFEKEWRSIIADVRRVYRGQITYSANWDDFDRVPFWDAVDLIGVQAYFPLGGKTPTRAEIIRAWDGHLARLEALSKKHGDKPLVFTEIGYARSRDAAAEPWKPAEDASAEARTLRTMLLELAFVRIAREPRVRGMFWWKWIPGRTTFDGDFSMKDEEALATLKRYWLE